MEKINDDDCLITATNPFCKNGKWYWYDETEDLSQPYETKESAESALRIYIKYFLEP